MIWKRNQNIQLNISQNPENKNYTSDNLSNQIINEIIEVNDIFHIQNFYIDLIPLDNDLITLYDNNNQKKDYKLLE